MDRQDWQRLTALLRIALDLDPAGPSAWRAGLQGEDPHVLDLLRAALENTGGDRAGDLIGPYRLLRRLGESGMARVFLAERVDGRLQRKVALKILRPEWMAHAPPEPFAQEAGALARLNHPSIVQIRDAGETTGGRPYLALEVVQGESLRSSYRAMTLPARLRLLIQLLRVVAYLHHRRVVHRALRLSSVMLTPQGQLKLVGFGLARALDLDPARVPPSDLSDPAGQFVAESSSSTEVSVHHEISFGADIFALGAMLFELLCGEAPFPGWETAGVAVDAALLADPAVPPSARAGSAALVRQLRGDLDSIVLKAMHRDPSQRYVSAAEFADDLERYLQRRPVGARKGGWTYRLHRLIARHASLTAIAVLASAALLAALLTIF